MKETLRVLALCGCLLLVVSSCALGQNTPDRTDIPAVAPQGTMQDRWDRSGLSQKLNILSRDALRNGKTEDAINFASEAVICAKGDVFEEPAARWSLALARNQKGNLTGAINEYRAIIFNADGMFRDDGHNVDMLCYAEYLIALLNARNWPEAVFIYDRIRLGIAYSREYGTDDDFPIRSIRFRLEIEEFSHLRAIAHLLYARHYSVFEYLHDMKVDAKVRMENIQEALNLWSTCWLTHHQMGMEYDRRREWAKARKEFETAVQLKPKAGAPHFWLARILDSINEEAKAFEEYKLAALYSTGFNRKDAANSVKSLAETAKQRPLFGSPPAKP